MRVAVHPVIRLVVVTMALSTAVAFAQAVPDGPLTALDGRLVVSGDVTATVGSSDEGAYFNYTDYQRNAMRIFRLGLSGMWRPVDRIAFVGEVRAEDFDHLTPYAAYVRVRPWRSRQFDIQAGRIPPSFGAFGRRAYGTGNPLIGFPLAYQYLTSLRPDAVPATADELLRMRGRGWLSSFSVGDPYEGPGVPLVSAFRWDTGVQARWTVAHVQMLGGVTNGTLSNPRFGDDNSGKQISGRVAFEPVVGLVAGASAARGRWLSDEVPVASSRSHAQTAYGADVEYSRDYWLVRGEIVWSGWELPTADLSPDGRVTALSAWVEGRYRLTPRIFVAARGDRLTFSEIAGSGGARAAWEAPVHRVELGAGYYLQRNLVVRTVVQRNHRDGGRVRDRTYWAGQLAYWF
jgi:hypothetical protein